MIENQIKIIEITKEWMHGCVIENTGKIKIKLENIWIDLFRSIYAPYIHLHGNMAPEVDCLGLCRRASLTWRQWQSRWSCLRLRQGPCRFGHPCRLHG